jgi:membrane protease YdiL (CAAX protease family)
VDFGWRDGVAASKVARMLTPFTMWLCTGTLALAAMLLAAGAVISAKRRRAEEAARWCPMPAEGEAGEAVVAQPVAPERGVACDFYRAFDGVVAIIVFALYLTPLVGAWMGKVGGEAGEINRTALVGGIVTQFMFTFMVMAAVVWRRNPVDWLGLRLPARDVWKWIRGLVGMAAAVIATWIVAALMAVSGLVDFLTEMEGGGDGKQEVVRAFETTQDPVALFLLAFMAVVVAPVAEEVVFRGYMYPVAKRYCGPVMAALGVSLLFSLVHYHAVGLIPLAFLAVLMTVAYEKSRSIWLPIAIHMIFNGMTVLVQLGQRFGWWEVPQ